jgi:hypothetical protein
VTPWPNDGGQTNPWPVRSGLINPKWQEKEKEKQKQILAILRWLWQTPWHRGWFSHPLQLLFFPEFVGVFLSFYMDIDNFL